MSNGIDFGKQVGPLPLGAWVIVVGGGLGIAVWQRRSAATSDPTPVQDTSGDTGVGTGPGAVGITVPILPGTDTGAITYDTNEAWGQAAINWLIAQGYNPGVSSSAITKALNGGTDVSGNKMSVQEWSLWSLALTHFGSPPYPVTVSPPTSVPGPVTKPPSPVPLPSPKPPPTKPKPPWRPPTEKVPPYHVVTAVHGDTISKIAGRSHKDWRTVWNFNLKYRSKATAAIMRARGPNLIFAGTTIWVPN